MDESKLYQEEIQKITDNAIKDMKVKLSPKSLKF